MEIQFAALPPSRRLVIARNRKRSKGLRAALSRSRSAYASHGGDGSQPGGHP